VFNNVTMTDLKGQKGNCYANCFLERKNGEVLAGTSGLGVLKFSDKSHATQLGGPLAGFHTINSMIEDKKGRLWLVADSRGVVCYDGQSVKHYLTDRNDLIFYSLCEDPQGVIYVGTTNSGVFRLSGNDFVHIEGTDGHSVSSLYCDHFGNIIIGYDGQGIAIYESQNDQVIDNPFFSMEVDLVKSKVYSITEDKSGNLWFGLLQKGIYMQPISFAGFNYMGYKLGARNLIGNACVISTLIDSQGRIWIGTDKDGLYSFDKQMRPLKHYLSGIPSTVMSLEEDGNGHIWVGSYGDGIGWIDPASQQYHPVVFPDDQHLIVMDIDCDKQGHLWLATLKYGLLCMDSKGNFLKRYMMKEGAETNRQLNSLTNNYVSQICVSPDGKRIYVSTSMGLCCLDLERDSWISSFGTNSPNYSTPVRIARE
jgi:ligand-binding sensor domain-containing protein